MLKSRGLSSVLLFFVVTACAHDQPTRPESSPSSSQGSKYTIDQLRDLVAKDFKVNIGTVEHQGSYANFDGFRSKYVLVSRRTDSRTYFVEDQRYKSTDGLGIAEDPDEALIKLSKGWLGKLGLPMSEIAHTTVLTQKLQTAKYDDSTKLFSPGEIKSGKRFVEATRIVNNVPVFSSRALVGVTRERGIGFLEMHWPEIPQNVLSEAKRLQELVRAGWKPPNQKGAKVESVEAGIIHSPALSFVMDQYAAIRVIYTPDEKEIGKKPVLYLDAAGKPVPMPRTFERPQHEAMPGPRSTEKLPSEPR